jgi:ElaB/YqjD/DUF883 family membrane-anchored ribosome-binding protein
MTTHTFDTKNLTSPGEAAKAIGAAAADAKASVGEALHSVLDAVAKGKTVAAEQFEAKTAAVVDYAKENPYRTVGIAALAGIAIGLLLFRR